MRLLLVDDEPSIKTALRLALEAEGHDVLTSSNYNDALELILVTYGGIHGLVTDVSFPPTRENTVCDNYGLNLALDALDFEIPVILMSGSERPADIHESLQALPFLHKPFDLHELLRLVNAWQEVSHA